jgi:hypothetical protein
MGEIGNDMMPFGGRAYIGGVDYARGFRRCRDTPYSTFDTTSLADRNLDETDNLFFDFTDTPDLENGY